MANQSSSEERWLIATRKGSDVVVHNGCFVKITDVGAVPDYWFTGDTTVVLGASPSSPENASPTQAHWDVAVPLRDISRFSRGFMVIGCLRRFGGLHSPIANRRADVWLNGRRIDGFALRVIPDDHSDYFHRPPLSTEHHLRRFMDCQTIYSWPVGKPQLIAGQDTQRIEIRIDEGVRWDVDYVGLSYITAPEPHRVFLSHGWEDKSVARRLAAKLWDRGIGVWLDEDEIKLGESLIEKIRAGIDSVEYVAVLLSESSVKSEWVRREVDVAMNQEIANRRVKVLPIRLDNCELPGFLLGKLYADLRKPDDLDRVVSQIEAQVTG